MNQEDYATNDTSRFGACLTPADDPLCTICHEPRSVHSEEMPYDTDECRGFSYVTDPVLRAARASKANGELFFASLRRGGVL
jgi:hypothetical protein